MLSVRKSATCKSLDRDHGSIRFIARKQLPAEPAFRAPPHNIEAEQALLGAILVNNEAFYRVSDFLEPKHFLEGIHQRIFELAGGLIRAGKLATPVTLKTFLPPDFDIAGLTVNQYLARLAAEATTIINAEDYGRTVYDLSIRRDLIAIGEDMVNLAYDAPVEATPQSHIEDAERKLFELAETGRYESGFQRFAQALTTAVDMAARAYQRDGSLSGLATGLTDLNSRMGGLQSSDLIILAGRPGMGKTALATNVAYNVAKAFEPGDVRAADGQRETVNGGVVGFFSLEMSAEQSPPASSPSRPASRRTRFGAVRSTKPISRRSKTFRSSCKSLPFYVDETGGLSIGQLAARARRLKRQRGLDLLVIDYIQLLQGRPGARVKIASRKSPKSPRGSRHSPRSSTFQSSRFRNYRGRSRPARTNTRNSPICVKSGSIEQDADVVLFVFREEYYHQMRKPMESNREKFDEWLAEGNRVEGKAEVIIGKQRHGPTGTVELQFDAAVTRFGNLDAAHRSGF